MTIYMDIDAIIRDGMRFIFRIVWLKKVVLMLLTILLVNSKQPPDFM